MIVQSREALYPFTIFTVVGSYVISSSRGVLLIFLIVLSLSEQPMTIKFYRPPNL